MSDIAPEAWQKEMESARAALRTRFPHLRCLRCDSDNFLVRMWPDESLVPGLASNADNRVVELICESCGFQEKHVVRLLAASEAG
jgi:ribosomal protein L37E